MITIDTIHHRIKAGHYLIRSHAVIHALKEGFERQDMVETILQDKIIEAYPDEFRVLILGTT